MSSHSADLDLVTRGEEGLFDTEMSSIELCEEHLSTQAARGNSILPDWFDRPGAPEAVEVGADVRNRYGQLSADLGTMCEDGTQLLQKVLAYEAEHDKLKEWLGAEKGKLDATSPPAITSVEIRQQLKEAKVWLVSSVM